MFGITFNLGIYAIPTYLHHTFLEGLCDFEEGDCGWIQQTDEDLDWIRVSDQKSNFIKSRPVFDHTTNTATGHYFYMDTTPPHVQGQRAMMTSPMFNAGEKESFLATYM